MIDLADVDFMDAAGASALRQGHKLAGDLGAQVTLRAPQSNVLRVLELTGTDLFMAIE